MLENNINDLPLDDLFKPLKEVGTLKLSKTEISN